MGSNVEFCMFFVSFAADHLNNIVTLLYSPRSIAFLICWWADDTDDTHRQKSSSTVGRSSSSGLYHHRLQNQGQMEDRSTLQNKQGSSVVKMRTHKREKRSAGRCVAILFIVRLASLLVAIHHKWNGF